MPFDRFLIAPINTGLQTNLRPWLIPDDAFEYLQNAYVFRGRVRKRFGSTFMGLNQYQSRLRINLGNTDGSGNISVTVPGNIFGIGQTFTIGTEIFTVYQLGTPAVMLDTGAATVKTYNTTTGALVINGAAATTAVHFYPGQPVMGLTQYESGVVNNHPSYAFDTQFAYLFTPNSGWSRSGSGTSPEWHTVGGSTINFFWTCNWKGITENIITMFVSNFQVTNMNGAGVATDDPLWETQDGSTWAKFIPYFLPAGGAPSTGPFVQTARIIVAFKDRLVLLNTVENDNSGGTGVNSWYPQRARYSFNGSPFATNAWYEPNQQDNAATAESIAAGAGFIDAATDEQIISAEFIKDRLIVYFERSTWELAYTGNEVLPFIWQKINTELGSQSTFSTVPFDKAILTIGESGVHACNGANVARIDTKIPDEIFEFETNNNATTRTFGIRDYYTELVYWTFLSDLGQPTQTFPNQLLVYNYENDSWGLFDDCYTAFGYFEQQQNITWASSAPLTWEQANMTWDSGVLSGNQRQIIAGTPEGYVLLIDDDISRNAPSMQITNISYASSGILTLTIINHNLTNIPSEFPEDNDFIILENIIADSGTMTFLNGAIFPVWMILNSNTVQINTFGGLTSGTYLGGGTAARVSNIQIYSKQWNPYVDDDRNFHLHKIDFGVQRTVNGQITVDYYPSATEVSMIQGGTASTAIMGNSVLETSPYNPSLYPLEQYQKRLWHPIYFQSVGECIQIVMYMSAAQMTNPNISLSDFVLEGLILYTQPTSARLE
jgi:hypothetical protein